MVQWTKYDHTPFVRSDARSMHELELSAARAAWKAAGATVKKAPETMDDGVRYLQLYEEEPKTRAGWNQFRKAAKVLADELPDEHHPFDVYILSLGLCWEMIK